MNQLNVKHAKFFNYSEEEILLINKIETFMPWNYKLIHKYFVLNFLRKHKSNFIKIYRMLYAATKENFIFPV